MVMRDKIITVFGLVLLPLLVFADNAAEDAHGNVVVAALDGSTDKTAGGAKSTAPKSKSASSAATGIQSDRNLDLELINLFSTDFSNKSSKKTEPKAAKEASPASPATASKAQKPQQKNKSKTPATLPAVQTSSVQKSSPKDKARMGEMLSPDGKAPDEEIKALVDAVAAESSAVKGAKPSSANISPAVDTSPTQKHSPKDAARIGEMLAPPSTLEDILGDQVQENAKRSQAGTAVDEPVSGKRGTATVTVVHMGGVNNVGAVLAENDIRAVVELVDAERPAPKTGAASIKQAPAAKTVRAKTPADNIIREVVEVVELERGNGKSPMTKAYAVPERAPARETVFNDTPPQSEYELLGMDTAAEAAVETGAAEKVPEAVTGGMSSSELERRARAILGSGRDERKSTDSVSRQQRIDLSEIVNITAKPVPIPDRALVPEVKPMRQELPEKAVKPAPAVSKVRPRDDVADVVGMSMDAAPAVEPTDRAEQPKSTAFTSLDDVLGGRLDPPAPKNRQAQVASIAEQAMRKPAQSDLPDVNLDSQLLDAPALDQARENKPSMPSLGSRRGAARQDMDKKGLYVFGPTKPGSRLEDIADSLIPSDDVSINQMMWAIYVKNPGAFINGDIWRLKEFYLLNVPDLDELHRIGKIEAEDQMSRMRSQANVSNRL